MKVGFTELLLVFAVALIVIGPERLPQFAKKLGEALGAFRKASSEAAAEIKKSAEPIEELKRPLAEAMQPLTETDRSVNESLRDIKQTIRDIEKPSEDVSSDIPDDHEEKETV